MENNLVGVNIRMADPVITNAPIQQFRRKSYFWSKVKALRAETGIISNVGYKYFNATDLEREYKRLTRRKVNQAIARAAVARARPIMRRQETERRQRSLLPQVAKAAASFASVRNESKEVDDFFNNPSNDKQLEIINTPIRDIIPRIRTVPGFNLLVSANNAFFTINSSNFESIIQKLSGEVLEIEREEYHGSDVIISVILLNPTIRVKFIWKGIGRQRPNGGYFRYYHKLDKIDLTRYGLYKNSEETDKYVLNCLEIAMLNAGVPADKFDKLKTLIRTRYIPRKDLKIIAEKLDIYISLAKLDDTQNKITYYGNKQHQKVNIGLINQHYFLIEQTNYTSYSVVNYFDLSDKANFNKIYRKDGNKYKRAERFISSFDLIKILLQNKETHLEEINITNCGSFSQYTNRAFDYTTLPEVENVEVKYCRKSGLKKPQIFIDFEKMAEYRDFKKIITCENVFDDPSFDPDEEEDNNIYYPYDVLHFDFESITNDDVHRPYLINSETRSDGVKQSFYGLDSCALKWLQSLDNNYICIAHNLRYDLQFLIKYIDNLGDMIKTGNKIKSISGTFYNKNTGKTIRLNFKDSYGLIPMPLRKFGKCFNLEVKKEIMPYEAFNKESIVKRYIKIQNASKFLKDHELVPFMLNLKKWKLIKNIEYFRHIEYSRRYCELDVEVLKGGYEIFRGWMQEVCNLDIDNAVSIPQIANTFGLNSGVFGGCYKISGVARDFIQKCVVGGRCMTRRNEKFRINHDVDDFDGVSLYPSAMNRMDGFLMGKPKVITDEIKKQIMSQLFATEEQTIEEKTEVEIKILNKLFSYDSSTNYKASSPIAYMIASRTRMTGLNLKRMLPSYSQEEFDAMVAFDGVPLTIASHINGMKEEDLKEWRQFESSLRYPDGYFIEIEVLDIKVKRDFPLLSRRNEQGIRAFDNDIKGNKIFVDRTSLEDLIKFQDLKFNILRGYYYNEGRNIIIKEFIKGLFDERLKKKKEGNPIQEVYKLIMNAFYGKLIQNPIEHDFRFVYGKDNLDRHLQYHFNSIESFIGISDGLFMVKECRSILEHFSMPHCGAEVLSMSKRIMNEVMCLAEDLGIDIYYQDTDSMHIDARKLESRDMKTGVELLAQEFKVRYERELVGKGLGQFHSDFDYKSDEPPISVESVYLGKKSYCDKIRVINDGEEEFLFHSRMKGIPGTCLENESKKYDNMINMYDHLLDGDEIDFDLLSACMFKFENNFTTTNNKEFKRRIKF